MRTAILVCATALAFPSAGTRAGDIPEARRFVGVTQASASVVVQSHVSGYLTRIAVKEGAAVKKGDLLVEIDPRQFELALAAAQARLKAADARLRAARILSTSTRKLFEKQVVSQEELDLKLAAETEAEATLELSKVEVEQAKLALSWTRITAPADGQASQLAVSEGGLVTADQTPIVTVVSTGAMHVSFNVPESTLLQLHREGLADPGKLDVAIGFAGEEGFPRQATLDRIDSEVNSKTGSVRFRALLPNPDGVLLPGMCAQVRLSRAAQ